MIDAISAPLDVSATLGNLPLFTPAQSAAIDKSAQDFEAMFATQLLQPMFETVSVNPLFGGGHGEEVMRSFLVQEYGKAFAKTGQLGIAPLVKAEMIKAQEAARGIRGSSVKPARQAQTYDAHGKIPAAKGAPDATQG